MYFWKSLALSLCLYLKNVWYPFRPASYTREQAYAPAQLSPVSCKPQICFIIPSYKSLRNEKRENSEAAGDQVKHPIIGKSMEDTVPN